MHGLGGPVAPSEHRARGAVLPPDNDEVQQATLIYDYYLGSTDNFALVWSGGRREQAARLHGAAAGIREATGAAAQTGEYAEHRGVLEQVERALGRDATAALLAAGRALTLDAALAEAFEEH
jgi:hypothetical protein